MASSITEAELLDALNEELSHIESEDGHTSEELAALMGWGKGKTLTTMKKLIVAGSWERCTVMRTSVLSDVTRPVNAYRPLREG
jgi:hypothetical protein